MTINDMIENARTSAKANGEKIDGYCGEYKSVMKLISAYYGGFNVGNMDAFNRVR